MSLSQLLYFTSCVSELDCLYFLTITDKRIQISFCPNSISTVNVVHEGEDSYSHIIFQETKLMLCELHHPLYIMWLTVTVSSEDMSMWLPSLVGKVIIGYRPVLTTTCDVKKVRQSLREFSWAAGIFKNVKNHHKDISEVPQIRGGRPLLLNMRGTDRLGWIIVDTAPAALHKDASLHSMKLSMWTWQSATRAMTQSNNVNSRVNKCQTAAVDLWWWLMADQVR